MCLCWLGVYVCQWTSMHLELICVLLIFQGQMFFDGRELLTLLLQLGVLHMHLLQLLGGTLIQDLPQSRKGLRCGRKLCLLHPAVQ